MTPDPASLAKQLNLVRGMRLWMRGVPDEIAQALDTALSGLSIEAAPSAGLDAALIAVPTRDAITAALAPLGELLTNSGFVWIGWRTGTLELDSAGLCDLIGPAWRIDVEPNAMVPGWCATKLVPHRCEPSAG
ncbi:hypothetical protein [Sphingomonas sp. 3-13AW]|jgi:hypothetical protein|uniref:hypothetical protein n=1 Tax=Sphingomonas sp. 3-13AW TaxID=3050450 RepID=UPI003BB54C4E